MSDDAELIRRYVDERSEAAFAELVRRHLNLVYFAALRQMGGDAHRAQDVTQSVFTDLARKATALSDRSSLAGWLHTSVRFAATKARRADRTREKYEQEARTMQALLNENEPAPAWERLRPLIDDVVQELNEQDREAVLLRFFEGHTFAEVGARLRLGEDAARVRVNRALDRMQVTLARRGVTSTSVALGVAMTSQAGAVAPAGLEASVTASALTAPAVAVGVEAGLASVGLTLGMKTAFGIVGGMAVLATGAAVYQTRQVSEARHVAAAAVQRQGELQVKLQEREVEVVAQSRLAQAADSDAAWLSLNAGGGGGGASPGVVQEAAAAAEPVTREEVQARYLNAKQLVRDRRNPEIALKELLWCFDEGMPSVIGYNGVRVSFLLSDIAKLGERHAPALAALRERRDAAERRLLAGGNDRDAVAVFASINRTLKEDSKTLALIDQFPPEDARRVSLGNYAFDQLVDARRYADAAQARPYSQMTSLFLTRLESLKRPPPANAPFREELQLSQLRSLVNSTAKCVEVLAGVGHMESARALAARLLAHDRSEATLAILQRHATRAGQPELLRNGTTTAP